MIFCSWKLNRFSEYWSLNWKKSASAISLGQNNYRFSGRWKTRAQLSLLIIKSFYLFVLHAESWSLPFIIIWIFLQNFYANLIERLTFCSWKLNRFSEYWFLNWKKSAIGISFGQSNYRFSGRWKTTARLSLLIIKSFDLFLLHAESWSLAFVIIRIFLLNFYANLIERLIFCSWKLNGFSEYWSLNWKKSASAISLEQSNYRFSGRWETTARLSLLIIKSFDLFLLHAESWSLAFVIIQIFLRNFYANLIERLIFCSWKLNGFSEYWSLNWKKSASAISLGQSNYRFLGRRKTTAWLSLLIIKSFDLFVLHAESWSLAFIIIWIFLLNFYANLIERLTFCSWKLNGFSEYWSLNWKKSASGISLGQSNYRFSGRWKTTAQLSLLIIKSFDLFLLHAESWSLAFVIIQIFLLNFYANLIERLIFCSWKLNGFSEYWSLNWKKSAGEISLGQSNYRFSGR